MTLFLNTEKLFAALPLLLNQGYVLLFFASLLVVFVILKKYQYSLRWLLPFKYIEKSITEDLLKQLYHVTSSQKTTDFRILSGALKIPERKILKIIESMTQKGLIQISSSHVTLTETGKNYALSIIRIHRLWEKYLSEKTGFDKTLWHDLAEAKEHQLSKQEAEALYEELGRPRFDPHGDPIPTALGEMISETGTSIVGVPVGTVAKIIHIEDEPKSIYRQIIKEKLHIGAHIKISASENHHVFFESEGHSIQLSTVVASNIQVVLLTSQEVYEEGKVRLSSLIEGEHATILGISTECRGANRRRLLDLGFIKGTLLTLEYLGPNQNPRAYRLRNTLIALRNDQADLILIEKTQYDRTRSL